MMMTNIIKKEKTNNIKQRTTEYEYYVTVEKQVFKFVQKEGTCLFKYDGEINSLKKIATAMKMLYTRFGAKYFYFEGKTPNIIKVSNNGREVEIYRDLLQRLKKY